MQSIAAAALSFALAGWPVLPVGKDKRPITALVPHGLTDASADPDVVRAWYANGDNNVGLTIPAGYLVIDVDDDEALARLEARFGPLPATREARTGSGGRHLWYTTTRDDLIQRALEKSTGTKRGVDTRVAGKGYVVAPPSIHANGEQYSWRDERDAVPVPTWVEGLLAPETATIPAPEPSGTDGSQAAMEYLLTCPPAIAGHGGHDATIRAAGVVVRGFALGPERGLDLLREVYNPRCIPPWTERELRHKVADAARSSAPPAWGSMLTAAPVAKVATPRKTLAERFSGLGAQGPRIRTGLATLDRATRGGPRAGKLVLVGGAPGACKTALVTCLAYRWAISGVPVAFLAADEEADAIAIRLGQAGGCLREHLEDGVPHALEAAAKRASGPLAALDLIDGDDEGATIEEAATGLRARANGGPAVLVVDSLQTARLARGAQHDSRRDEVDARLAALKAAAKMGLLVVATTELARGSYRSKQSAEQIDDLAAAKESGGIEYAASLLLVLRSLPGSADTIDVTMPKNRLGNEKPAFRFKLDFDRATVSEVERPADKTAADRFATLRANVAMEVRLAAERGKPHGSGAMIARVLEARKQDVLEALKELERDGEILNDGHKYRPMRGVGAKNIP